MTGIRHVDIKIYPLSKLTSMMVDPQGSALRYVNTLC